MRNYFDTICFDSKWYGDKLTYNKYFSFFTIFGVAILGGICAVIWLFNFMQNASLALSMPTALSIIIIAWLFLLAETIICAKTIGTAIGRAFFTLAELLVAFIFGGIVSLVMLIILVIFIIGLFAAGTVFGGSGSSSKSGSNEDDYVWGTDSEGNNVKLHRNSDGINYSDDFGRQYRNSGSGNYDKFRD